MERLTEKAANSNMVWFKDTENEGMRLEPCEMTAHHSRMTIERLAAYEDAEEQGRIMPCKVGNQIYAITYDNEQEKYIVTKSEIIEITKNCNGWFFKSLINKPAFRLRDFGKRVFLTKEEAEAKLKELEGYYYPDIKIIK